MTIKRKAPLKRKGGHRFPKAHDSAYWAWLSVQRIWTECDACGSACTLAQRAHLIPRSRGGGDLNNVSLLCYQCHNNQEKRTDAFIAETGVDLYAKARAHTQRYLKEHPDA